jgi:hypothetical protein
LGRNAIDNPVNGKIDQGKRKENTDQRPAIADGTQPTIPCKYQETAAQQASGEPNQYVEKKIRCRFGPGKLEVKEYDD